MQRNLYEERKKKEEKRFLSPVRDCGPQFVAPNMQCALNSPFPNRRSLHLMMMHSTASLLNPRRLVVKVSASCSFSSAASPDNVRQPVSPVALIPLGLS